MGNEPLFDRWRHPVRGFYFLVPDAFLIIAKRTDGKNSVIAEMVFSSVCDSFPKRLGMVAPTP